MSSYILILLILVSSLILVSTVRHHHHDIHDHHDSNMMKVPSSNVNSSSPIDNIIILVGLPKSGTTSIHDALVKLGVNSNHHHVMMGYHHQSICDDIFPIPAVTVSGADSSDSDNDSSTDSSDGSGSGTNTKPVKWPKIVQETRLCFDGVLVQYAIAKKQKPLKYLIDMGIQAFAQLDVCYPEQKVCIWPQLDAIKEITDAYPDAYYVHTRRSSLASHVASMNAWGDHFDRGGDYMLNRLKQVGLLSKYPNQSKNFSDSENGEIWISDVTEQTIAFFQSRPHLKFIDVCIENTHTPQLLADFFHVPKITLEHDNTGHYDSHKTAAPTPVNADEQWLNAIITPTNKPTPVNPDENGLNAYDFTDPLKRNRLRH